MVERLGAWLTRVRPVELAEFLKKLLGVGYGEYTVAGHRWYLDPASDHGQRLLREGTYEGEATAAMCGLLRPGDVFMDVGANEGWFSVHAAQKVLPLGQVVAVEPQARLWPVIERNFTLAGLTNYTLVKVAAGATSTTSEIHLYPSLNPGASSMVPQLRTKARPREAVEVRPLDFLFRTHGISHVRLMKIDVEGFELEVLKGAGDRLGRDIDYIFVELHPPLLQALKQTPAQVEKLLTSRGYQIKTIRGVTFWARAGSAGGQEL